MNTGVAGAAVVFTAVAAFFGDRLFLVAVLILAGVALLEMAAALEARGPRPVVLAAAVAGFGTPLRAALQPDEGLASLPALVVAMLLLAFVLLIATGGRSEATRALGATMLCGLLVGLGAGALMVLQAMPGGWRWVVGLVVVVGAGAVALGRRTSQPAAGSASLPVVVGVLATAPAVALLVTALSS